MSAYSKSGASHLVKAIKNADAVIVGAGAGLSTAAGLTYSGQRFHEHFADFIDSYGFTDMYSAGFYPFESFEEQWAYWSRHIWYNRYIDTPKDTYDKLRKLLEDKDFFILTTNVDHRFQWAGFPKERLFYTQGDYGLWQCSKPCHDATYDNYEAVKRMVDKQRNMRIPSNLVPRCPKCGEPMSMNLRADSTFVEDAGWHEAAARYGHFLTTHSTGKVLYLELGVGMNTPSIVKYPFWHYTYTNLQAVYACINYGEAYAPAQIQNRSIVVDADIDALLDEALSIKLSAKPQEEEHGTAT
ncbi:MAG: Sir2 silent information regulator family NAD-dependent deacetylase [Atopobium sp.]|uniref:SIR2 family NAD-dependent protein deacylase n=1 Tax=Atopobium sp. TaxID=1872650 RepID=UPI002A7570BB|nr:Sir2 silent information regulator family NAD-dependent deacetylase [Atopobium sp.]MDY2788572.1 Sir2 silent information regulator family NAD-dependent deacetylase [Atopobium sp.]